MNNLQIFNNAKFGEIRTIDENGTVLFCGSDIAKALGYADTAKAIKLHCKEDGWAICPVIDSMENLSMRGMFIVLLHTASFLRLNSLSAGCLTRCCQQYAETAHI